jgi:hypothetical protein
LSATRFYSFSHTLSFALCERLFFESSSCDGSIGFLPMNFIFGLFPHTQTGKLRGQVQPLASEA